MFEGRFRFFSFPPLITSAFSEVSSARCHQYISCFRVSVLQGILDSRSTLHVLVYRQEQQMICCTAVSHARAGRFVSPPFRRGNIIFPSGGDETRPGTLARLAYFPRDHLLQLLSRFFTILLLVQPQS